MNERREMYESYLKLGRQVVSKIYDTCVPQQAYAQETYYTVGVIFQLWSRDLSVKFRIQKLTLLFDKEYNLTKRLRCDNIVRHHNFLQESVQLNNFNIDHNLTKL